MSETIKIIECPRDAMQGIKTFIPTQVKARYLQSLLEVGFDTIDFGSFVSPKAIPQMRDTAEVLASVDLSRTQSKLLAIVANLRGAEQAVSFDEIQYLGYPFSISENFQMRNTHRTIADSVILLDEIVNLVQKHGKELVVYLSMGFGNPYGDPWNEEIVAEWMEKLTHKGIQIISLSDTIGQATPEVITHLFSYLVKKYPKVEIGAHFHTHPTQWREKIEAAYHSGCRRFDSAIQGFGGCPMAKDELVGNMPTEKMLTYFQSEKAYTGVNMLHFESSYNVAKELFSEYH